MSDSVKQSNRDTGSKGGYKRKKSYYRSFNKKTKFAPFKDGVQGFLISFNKKEHCALNEAYFLLNKYADKILEKSKTEAKKEDDQDEKSESSQNPEEKSNGNNKSEIDLEDALRDEIKDIKEGRKRFNQMTTKCPNALFIEAHESVNPNQVVTEMFDDIKENGSIHIQHIMKMIPVTITCGAHLDNIKKTFSNIIETKPEDETSYYILPRVRSNDSMGKDDIIRIIGEVVHAKRDKWKPDYTNAQITIAVDVMNKICCIALLDNFNYYRKYNPTEFISWLKKSKEPESKEEKAVKTEVKAESEGSKAHSDTTEVPSSKKDQSIEEEPAKTELEAESEIKKDV